MLLVERTRGGASLGTGQRPRPKFKFGLGKARAWFGKVRLSFFSGLASLNQHFSLKKLWNVNTLSLGLNWRLGKSNVGLKISGSIRLNSKKSKARAWLRVNFESLISARVWKIGLIPPLERTFTDWGVLPGNFNIGCTRWVDRSIINDTTSALTRSVEQKFFGQNSRSLGWKVWRQKFLRNIWEKSEETNSKHICFSKIKIGWFLRKKDFGKKKTKLLAPT